MKSNIGFRDVEWRMGELGSYVFFFPNHYRGRQKCIMLNFGFNNRQCCVARALERLERTCEGAATNHLVNHFFLFPINVLEFNFFAHSRLEDLKSSDLVLIQYLRHFSSLIHELQFLISRVIALLVFTPLNNQLRLLDLLMVRYRVRSLFVRDLSCSKSFQISPSTLDNFNASLHCLFHVHQSPLELLVKSLINTDDIGGKSARNVDDAAVRIALCGTFAATLPLLCRRLSDSLSLRCTLLSGHFDD
ncbi:hypothetical protein PFISCL1PPCAC_7723, partial [Pristionchus fissidentatus]